MPTFELEAVKIQTFRITAPDYHAAVRKFVAHRSKEWRVQAIEETKTGDYHTVLGYCEGCDGALFEGDAHTFDMDGFYLCPKCGEDPHEKP